jgi:phage terminase large subunit
MKITVSKWFAPLLDIQSRYLVLCGGAGSGKSEFAGRKIFYRAETEGHHRYLIMRKVRRTLKDSVIPVMAAILQENGVPFDYNKSDRVMRFRGPNGWNEWWFEGLDDPEKIKSIKGITSVWLEETTEFSKDDFIQIDLRLREATGHYHQIILSFNPDESRGAWLKKMFFDEKNEDACVNVSTIDDNPIKEIRDKYRARLDKLNDPVYLSIYRHARWALPRGVIFDWDVVACPPSNPDEIIYGGDFGYSIDPAVALKIYRKADEFWLEELIYETGLTNQDLGSKFLTLEPKYNKEPFYCDSAEPKSIEELYRMGINAKPSVKGPDSVRAGIDYLKSVKIHIVDGSSNLINERSRYKWKQDKAGNNLPVPVEFFDHAMTAGRYGIYSHCRTDGEEAGAGFIERDIYPD